MRPTHGGAVMKPVGSTAVRDAIQRYQPPLSVHGHIHESRGVAKVGRTLAMNPGSSYSDGVLQAALIDITRKRQKLSMSWLTAKNVMAMDRAWESSHVRSDITDLNTFGGDLWPPMPSATKDLRFSCGKLPGLVRGWSVRDSMIYACLSTNVITLGLVEFAYQDAFPTGQLLTAVLISGRLGLVPRPRLQRARRHDPAGGRRLRVADRRILGSGLGFVMAATGWWFILWLWAPIYGSVLAEEFFQPLWVTFNDPSGAAWFATHTGTFVVTLITIALAGLLVSLGMAGYAQRAEVVLLRRPARVRDHRDLAARLQPQRLHLRVQQRDARKLFGMKNAYAGTIADAGSKSIGYTPRAVRRGRARSASRCCWCRC